MTIDQTVDAIPMNDKSATRLRRTFKVTGPASYVTGGDPFGDIGFGSRIHVLAGSNVMRSSGGGATCRLVALNVDAVTAPTLQWYDLAGAEIAAGVDLSAYSGNLELIGQ